MYPSIISHLYPLGLPVRGNVPGQAGDIPGPPGIFPPETGNVPLTPLSSDPSGIFPAGGNIPGPIGNIPGRRGYPPAHREYPRPAGISPAPIENIPGRREYPRPDGSVISRAGGEYPRPPLGISPAGGNIPGPAHREYCPGTLPRTGSPKGNIGRLISISMLAHPTMSISMPAHPTTVKKEVTEIGLWVVGSRRVLCADCGCR